MKKLLILPLLLLLGCSESEIAFVEPCTPFSDEYVDSLDIPAINRHNSIQALTVSERVNCIPAATSASKSEPKVVFSAELEKVNPGDILHIDSMLHVENPLKVNLLLAYALVLSDSPYDVDGEFLTEEVGSNITPGNHYSDRSLSLTLVAEKKIRGQYINLVAITATDANVLNQHGEVKSTGGFLSVVLERR